MTRQIAVKLPDELVDAVDALVRAGSFASRSQIVRRGVETVVSEHRRREIDAAYREAYARCPETDEEIAEAMRLGIESINEEPWEKWW